MKLKINSNFKYGFTLAEVLIALVIVGIVAALVISPLINTYVENSTVAKVKKGLSILGQAKKLAEVQNGPIDGWDFGEGFSAETTSQFFNYLRPYLSIAKDCGGSQDCYSGNVYTLNGILHDHHYSTNSDYYKFVLADGSVMFFSTGGEGGAGKCSVAKNGIDNVCAIFLYDVNGNKPPNTFGRDIFFYLFAKDAVYPYIINNCKKNEYGSGCSGYIIKHNNMNYLH